MARVVLALAVFAVTVYALVDCIQTEEDRVKHLPKMAWAVLIVIAPPIGAVAWLITSRVTGRPQRRTGGPRPAGPRGPDDDPDFLRGI